MTPNPADYDQAFAIITSAGSSKSNSMMAIRCARQGDFEAARALLAEADHDLHEAHRAQTELLTEEARGHSIPVNIILVHAQDHLTGALLVRDLADEFIFLHEQLRQRGPVAPAAPTTNPSDSEEGLQR